MSNKFTSGRISIAECDRCGQRYKLKQLKELVIRTKKTNILVCPLNNLGALGEGSRQIQWGWNPVGFGGNSALTPNDLAAVGVVGTVGVTIS
mgnify:CR=1 FL=1